jgi:hypothetical protein
MFVHNKKQKAVQAARKVYMKAESVGENPFKRVADALMGIDGGNNMTREGFTERAPWLAIRSAITVGEWNACLASISDKRRSYHSGNDAWEAETLEILQASSFGKKCRNCVGVVSE